MSMPVQKSKARGLRFRGQSIKRIAKNLNVSIGSVRSWTLDIKLTSKQRKSLDAPYYGGRGIYLKGLRQKTASKIKRLEKNGIREIGNLNRRELFLSGAVLYWAEGFKKDKQAGLASLDPKMIKFFIKWLSVCFGYKNEDLVFRVSANISHRDRIKAIEKYWSKTLNIHLEQFQKPFFQNFKWKKTYKNPEEYFGVMRIKVRKSQDFLRKIYGFIEGIKLNS